MEQHYKISREILNLGKKLSVKMNVVLLGDNNKWFITQFSRPGIPSQKGINLNSGCFISFEYKLGTWSKDKTILINELNLSKVVKGFKNIHKNVYDGEIFAQNKQGKVIIYNDRARECTEHIRVGTQNMLLQPAIITDDSGLTYEGIILYMNNMDNAIELPIDWLDGIIHVLDKIDMFMYSQALLNFYIAYQGSDKSNTIETKSSPAKDKTFELRGSKSTLVKNEDVFKGLEDM